MPITFTANSATISTTEYSLPSVSTDRVAQTDDCILQAFIDLNAMAAGDEYELKVYEKVNGQTQRLCHQAVIAGAQSEPVFVTPTLLLGEGWDVTLKRTAGSDRVINWSLRKIT